MILKFKINFQIRTYQRCLQRLIANSLKFIYPLFKKTNLLKPKLKATISKMNRNKLHLMYNLHSVHVIQFWMKHTLTVLRIIMVKERELQWKIVLQTRIKSVIIYFHQPNRLMYITTKTQILRSMLQLMIEQLTFSWTKTFVLLMILKQLVTVLLQTRIYRMFTNSSVIYHLHASPKMCKL